MASTDSDGGRVNGDQQPRRRSSLPGMSKFAGSQASSNSPPPLPMNSQPQSNNQQQVTVETETVPSVPTLAVNPNLTIRVKKSQDSVPRVSSSKGAAKRRSLRLAQGSKADIFAAKVANAVEEQDSSDDETFVYQAPITSSHASESLRRPYMRSVSNSSSHAPPTLSSLYHPGDSYFPDETPQSDYESDLAAQDNSEALGDDSTAPPSRNGGSGQQQTGQILQSPRSFVVPKVKTYSQQHGGGHHSVQPPQSSSSSIIPFPSSTQESDGYDDNREFPWIRHSRQGSRTRMYNNGDSTSPTRDPYDSIRAKHSYLQRWRAPTATSQSQYEDALPEELLDERASLLKGRPSLYNYQSSRNSHGRRRNNNALSLSQQQQLNQSHSSRNLFDSEQQVPPEFLNDEQMSPADSHFSKFQAGVSLSTKIMVFATLVLISLLSMVFVTGVLLAAARPLREFSVVALSDVLVSDKELRFTMITYGRNPGFFSREVSHGELDIFATSLHADSGDGDIETSVGSAVEVHSSGNSKKTKPRTVLLGTITELESPMIFHGGLSSQPWQSGSAKLVSPLANNTALWGEISAYEFDLTVKGILAYNTLGGEHRETVSRAYHVVAPEFPDKFHEPSQ